MHRKIGLYILPLTIYLFTFLLPEDAYLFKSVFSLLIIILVPYFIGRSVAIFLSKEEHPVVTWLLGNIVTIFILYIAESLHIFDFGVLMGCLYILASIQFFFDRSTGIAKEKVSFSIKKIYPYLILLTVAIGIGVYFRSLSPFPLQSGNDNIFLSGLANEILNNDFTNSNFFVYSYLPFIPTLLAVGSLVAHVNPIHVLWMSPFLLYSVYAVGIYLFLKKKTENKVISLLVASAFFLLFGFEGRVIDLINFREKNLFLALLPLIFIAVDNIVSSIKSDTSLLRNSIMCMFFCSFFVSSSTLVFQLPFSFTLGVLMIFLLILFTFLKFKEKNAIILFGFLGMGLSFLHAYVGIFFVSIFLIYLIAPFEKKGWYARVLTILLLLCLLFFAYIYISDGSSSINLMQLESDGIFLGGQYNFDISKKLNIAISTFTPYFVAISLLGALLVLFRRQVNRYPYALMFMLTAAYVLLPINFSYRLIELLIPFIALFIAIAILSIKEMFKNSSGFVVKKLYLFIVCILFVYSIPQASSYVTWLYDNGYASKSVGLTNYTIEEYKAALWIKDNYPDNTYIFTSPELTRSIIAISGKTKMLRSKAQEYQYLVSYPTHPEPNCRQIFLNGYGISSSNVSNKNGKIVFLIDTVDKVFLKNKENTITLINCKAEQVGSLIISANDTQKQLHGYEKDNNVLFKFENFDAGRKHYLVSIFDTVGDLRELRRSIFKEMDAEVSAEVAKELIHYYDKALETDYADFKPGHALIFVSGPASLWVRDPNETQKLSADFEKFHGFEKFFNEEYFTLVYEDPDNVYVFEVVN